MQRKLYAVLASLIQARANCIESNNEEWRDRHEDRAQSLVKEYMPSGSGFDSGTHLDWDRSTTDKLIFTTSYHAMNEGGYYDGWTNHAVIVRPSLANGYYLRITGPNPHEFKDYAHEVFSNALDTLID